MNRNNRIALGEYIRLTREASELIAYMSAFIDDHGEIAPDAVDWPDVGSMSKTVDMLRDVKNFITGGDEE